MPAAAVDADNVQLRFTIESRFDESEWRPTLTLHSLASLPVEVAA